MALKLLLLYDFSVEVKMALSSQNCHETYLLYTKIKVILSQLVYLVCIIIKERKEKKGRVRKGGGRIIGKVSLGPLFV